MPVSSTSGSSNGGSECDYLPIPPDEVAILQLGPGPGGAGYWVIADCLSFLYNAGPFWVPIGAAPTSPQVVAGEAFREMQLPAPALGTNPPVTSGSLPLVNLPTLFWVDPAQWRPLSITAAIGGVSATAVATPQQLIVGDADGTTTVCNGPGHPYQPGVALENQLQCAHTYRWSSAAQPGNVYTLQVHVMYRVTWSSSTGATGDFGLVPSRTAAMPLPVGEIQTPVQVQAVGP